MSLIVALVVTPAPALAQGGSNPFGPLPQTPQPPPEQQQPQPQPVQRDDERWIGGRNFWMLVGSTALVFAGIAFLIGRDMRRTVGRPDRRKRRGRRRRAAADAAEALAEPQSRHTPGSHKARAKAQKRAKAKAARRQRRRQRSR